MVTSTTSIVNGSITVDPKTGRVSFSGLGSGIDVESTVDAIMNAKQIPVDNIKSTISANTDKIAAYRDLSALLSTLKNSVDQLRGAVSFDASKNAFLAKTPFASTSRSDGLTPNSAANLIGVSVTNAASLGSHTVEILRTAAAHKIGSMTFSSATVDLGTASGGAANSISGSFSINGRTITVDPSDTLQALRDRINAANTGTNPTGVTASIVSIGANQQVLVLTADKTGTPITIADETNGVLAALGISNDGGATFANQLQAPQTAQFYADGLLDSSKYQSAVVSSPGAALSGVAGVSAGTHSFEIRDASGALLKTVTYSDTDTLASLAAAITDAGAGITATVVADGSGYRLKVDKDDGSAITLTNDSDNLLSGLGVGKERLLIERSSNTVNDLFAGVTLSLYGAEPGTTIKLDIDRDLSGVQTAINNFVSAYNAVREFINTQNQTGSSDGTKDDSSGPLFGSSILSDLQQALTRIVGGGAQGVSKNFSSLGQIGIGFVDNNSLDDPLKANTLTLDSTKLEQALLNNPDDVRRLFSFDFSSSDPRITLLGFTGKTAYNPAGYTLNLTSDGTNVTGADINGVAGSATVKGKTITLTDATGAAGLSLFYSGSTDLSGVTLNFTVGVGAQLFFGLDSFLDQSTGSIEAEIKNLTDQNTQAQSRVDEMTRSLDYQRQQLSERYQRMNTSIATMQTIIDSIKQAFQQQQQD
ncbi:MAG: flagellar filament capping protein FliD [Rhodospirillaceae bacterium]|nr:flagellar filament capping protein FliD [Rhodospirillaceae bacterium]